MPRFRATVYILTSQAEAVEGNKGIQRRIMELSASDEGEFKARIQDQYIYNMDNDVSFGPVSRVPDRE